jgi:hypothetical protein
VKNNAGAFEKRRKFEEKTEKVFPYSIIRIKKKPRRKSKCSCIIYSFNLFLGRKGKGKGKGEQKIIAG